MPYILPHLCLARLNPDKTGSAKKKMTRSILYFLMILFVLLGAVGPVMFLGGILIMMNKGDEGA